MMFSVKNPCQLGKPWILSRQNEPEVAIPLEITNLLKNYHIIAIEFLYRNFRKGVLGSILNVETRMNVVLEITAFISATVVNAANILVISSTVKLPNWLYHLEQHAGFVVELVTKSNVMDIQEQCSTKRILLVADDDFKLCENFRHFDFFVVIIENLDKHCKKRLLKHLNGHFNIGLTRRNFYTDPSQVLQWHMLNWANPGCVGKLQSFYKIDDENLGNFADNYRFWWLRLTWNFCESFEKPTDSECEAYNNAVSEWAAKTKGFLPKAAGVRKKRQRAAKQVPNEEVSRILENVKDETPVPADNDNNFVVHAQANNVESKEVLGTVSSSEAFILDLF